MIAVAVAAVLVAATPGVAQDATIERFERQLEQIRRETRLMVDPDVPADQRALVDVGAYLSQFFLAVDDLTNNTRVVSQTDLNAYGRVDIDGVHQFFVRGRFGWRGFLRGDSFDGRGDRTIGPRFDRGIYRFDLRRYFEAYEGRTTDFNLTIQGGRQLVHWVNGLTLSQEIDGGLVSGELGPFRLDTLAGRTRRRQVDFDSSRPRFDREMRRNFFGAMLSYELTPKHRPFIYGLVQRDRNPDRRAFGHEFDYDSHYIGFGSTGAFGDNLLYGAEAVVQGGEGLSFNPVGDQTREDIRAWAVDFRGDYLFNDPANSRFSGEVLLASGDTDRAFHTSNTIGGNQPGTTDRAFNAFGLVNTGLSFSPNVSNLFMVRLGASTFPFHTTDLFRRLQVGGDFFVYNKVRSGAPIDELTQDGRFLGVETDLYANWQVTSDFAFSLRYGVFFPGTAIEATNKPRHFLFTGLTLAF